MLISQKDIPKDWQILLGDYFASPAWLALQASLRSELQTHPELIRPEAKNFFKALFLTPVDQVKVIILGQDPLSLSRSRTRLGFFYSIRYLH